MGPQQLGLLELYSRFETKTETTIHKLAKRATLSLVQPSSADALVADSGCSATALAAGVTALPGTLGLNAQGAVVDLVAQWQAENPDTLLIVTADHETGGFGFSYSSAAIPTPHALAAQLSGTLPYAADYNFVSPAVLKNLAQQKTPIAEIFRQVKVGAQQPDSAQRLIELVQSTLGHQITTKQATDLLTPERNEFRVPGHADLNDELVPKINDFSAFYPKSINRATAALARLLAARSGIVWATGNHTSTPVPLFAIGPGQDSFKGIPTQVDVGAKLASIF